MSTQVQILGVSDSGLEGLSSAARALLSSATLLAGGVRHLSFANDIKAEKFILKGNLKELVERLEAELAKPEGKPIVLASGDPLFFGVGKYLIGKLGAARVRVHPYLSSMQLAFARAGVAWDDAVLLSVHGRALDELAALAPTALRVGVFTDTPNHPGEVARYLIELGWPSDAQAWVVEHIEGPQEKVTAATLADLKSLSFGDLNVVIAQRASAPAGSQAHAFGLPDETFAQRKPEKGLITRAEIRTLSLAKMRVFPGANVWDVGAATGSVAIEAARRAAQGQVWAIEKNAEDCDNIRENIIRFHTPTVRVLHGSAPDVLAQIPANADPDSVFVGGTAGKMNGILDACLARLKPSGSVVVNAVTIENIAEALAWFQASGLDWGFMQVQVSRGKAIKTPTESLHRLDALNPVHIFWGTKEQA